MTDSLPTTPKRRGERFHQLDGLRAIACMLVIIHHVCTASIGQSLDAKGHHFLANAMATTTASGVELFFVLSGTLLLRPYIRSNRKMEAGKYLIARVRRLWPPYLAAWILAGAVILATTLAQTWWTRGANLPVFHVSSWLAQLGIVYLGNQPFSFAWWSLTIEVIFYLMVPALVVLLLRTAPTPKQLYVTYIAAIVVSVLATNIPDGVVPAVMWPLPRFLMYVHCFVGGIILARIDLPKEWARKLIMVGVPYALAAFACPRLNVHVGWGMIYLGIVSLALTGEGSLKTNLSRWLMVWIGERSYSLFLTHYSVITGVCYLVSLLTGRKGAGYFLVTRAIELPLVLLAGMFVFHYIERRFAKNLETGRYFWPTLSQPHDATVSELATIIGTGAVPA